MKDHLRAATTVAALGFALGGYAATLHQGEIARVGNGTARAWVRVSDNGTPIALGITLTESAMTGLPTEPPPGLYGMIYPLSFPPQAASTVVDHATVDWNMRGHIPPGIYDVPHWDFHFFTLPRNEIDAIELKTDDDRKMFQVLPPAGSLPDGYIAFPGSEEPKMGIHWGRMDWPEINGKPFTQSFVYGSHNGRVTFLEPMVAMTWLLGKPSFSAPVPMPKLLPKGKWYPSVYSIRYETFRKEYVIELSSFVKG